MNDELATNVPLAPMTWFRTGGPARFFAEPRDAAAFCHAVNAAQGKGAPLFVLGEGANVLISDDGFDGIVVRPRNAAIQLRPGDDTQHTCVTAGAGTHLQDLIDYCLANNLCGLEDFSGIPGTVGGSVYINVHYFEALLSQFLVSARVVAAGTGSIETVDNEWFRFGYDTSRLHERKNYLLDATFRLRTETQADTAYARGRRDEIIRHRMRRYPTERTCGSFFRNFLPDEVPFETNGKKITAVAYYLDRVGVKGELRVGNAAVSHKHANMIVTSEGAASADVAALARRMQELVRDAFGLVPQPECQLVGFERSPLL